MTIDLGNYEKLQFSASVTMGHEDLGYTDQEAQEICVDDEGCASLQTDLIASIMRCLNGQLEGEIQAASGMTANEKSVLIREARAHHDKTTKTARR